MNWLAGLCSGLAALAIEPTGKACVGAIIPLKRPT
jgi:hypothetical protein